MADKVKFRCGDGEVLDVATNLAHEKFGAHFCGLITNAVEKGEEVNVPRINKRCLEKVVEWCTYFLDHEPPVIEPPLCHSDLRMVVDEWSATFIEVEQDMLFELIEAGVYLDIVALEKLAGAKIASQIRLKSCKEIRQYFSIVNDFTPEEEEKIKNEERWTEATFQKDKAQKNLENQEEPKQ